MILQNHMNTNTAIGVVVAVVVVLIGGYYLMNGSSVVTAPSTNTQGEVTSTEEATAEKGVKASFIGLAKRSGSWKCTVDVTQSTSISSGVTYVANGKVRGDFTTNVQGYGDVETHVLSDGQYAYTWSSVMPQGIKTDITGPTTSGAYGSTDGVTAQDAYVYDCEPWTADASLFVAPGNIDFRAL
jgi:hypothetical protein